MEEGRRRNECGVNFLGYVGHIDGHNDEVPVFRLVMVHPHCNLHCIIWGVETCHPVDCSEVEPTGSGSLYQPVPCIRVEV